MKKNYDSLYWAFDDPYEDIFYEQYRKGARRVEIQNFLKRLITFIIITGILCLLAVINNR